MDGLDGPRESYSRTPRDVRATAPPSNASDAEDPGIVDGLPSLPPRPKHFEKPVEVPQVSTMEGHDAPVLDQGWALPRLGLESLSWIAVLGAATIVRIASLTNMPYSAAEGQRAYAALQWIGGENTRVDGHLWGPFPFLVNGLFVFLFGARDAIGRLPFALAGVALVAMCSWLRPHIGRWGALGTAAMIALSPTFVYGARQIMGIPWAALGALALFVSMLRLADDCPTTATVVIGTIAVAFLLGSGPEGLTMLLAFALALAIVFAFAPRRMTTMTANLLRVDRCVRLGALALGVLFLVVAFSLFFTDIVHLPRTLADIYGAWWGDLLATQRDEPWFYYLMVAFVYEPFVGTAAIVGLIVIARMTQPRPLWFILPVAWQIVALALFSLSDGKTPEATAMLLLPLAILGGIAVQWAAERLAGGWFWRERGWMLGVAAFILALALAQFIRQLLDVERSAAWIATILVVIALILATGYATTTLIAGQGRFRASTALLATLLALSGVMAIRAMSDVAFTRPADGHELLVGTRTAASVAPFVARVRRISVDLTRQARTFDPSHNDRNNIAGGNTLAIQVDESLRWPLQWYFRDFPNFAAGNIQTIAAEKPTLPDGTPAPRIVVVSTAHEEEIAPSLPGYTLERVPIITSFPSTYRSVGVAGLMKSLVSPHAWVDRMRYFLDHQVAQRPETVDASIFYSPEITARIFYVNPAISAQKTAYNLLDKAGKGTANGQFNAPRGVTIGPDGTITVVDQLNYRVQQFAADGTFLRSFGSVGTAPDKFGQIPGYATFGPTGVATDKDGTIFVADTWNHRVSVFTSKGQPTRQWGKYVDGQRDPAVLPSHPADFYGPRGIAIGPDELVYVTDAGNGRVGVFKTDGTFVRTFGSRGAGPGQLDDAIGISVRQDGVIAVADPNNARVQLFASDGQYLAPIPVPDWGMAKGLEPYIVWLPNGNLLVPSPVTNAVYEITQTGQTRQTLSGDFHRPTALALTRDGKSVLVANDETCTVVQVLLQ